MTITKFTFQWHITEVCNYRCAHCYQESYTNQGADLTVLISYLDKIETFINKLKETNPAIKPHINFTGGEPFMKNGFLDLLTEVRRRKIFSFGILSNGFLLPKPELVKLQALKPKFIQLSIEGNKQTNEVIRGSKSYDEVILAIKTYRQMNIPVLLSFTANALNYKQYNEVAKFARKNKVTKLWTDRFLPIKPNDELVLSTNGFADLMHRIGKEKRSLNNYFTKTQLGSDRALQFLFHGGKPYKCSAADSLLAILPNGDIMPCRRLPIVLGNMNIESLFELYTNNQHCIALRNAEKLNSECSQCFYKNSCSGGLRCLTFAKLGSYLLKDPNCIL